MSTHNYRKLLTNLPSLASIVNSFHSPEVQLEVYHLLIQELTEATLDSRTTPRSFRSSDVTPLEEETEPLSHDLVDGDSLQSGPEE